MQRSCRKCEIKLFHNRPEMFAEDAVDGTENVVGLEVLTIHAAASNDVIAHLFQPQHLICCEPYVVPALRFDPLREPRANVLFEWLEHWFLFERNTDQRDKVRETASSGAARYRGGLPKLGKCRPKILNRVGSKIGLQLLFQFSQAFFCETLAIRPAVEDLQSRDLVVMLLDVFSKRSHAALGLLSCCSIKSMIHDVIYRHDIDRLFVVLLQLHERVTQNRIIKLRTCLRH